jgi:predicted dehydrogenase
MLMHASDGLSRRQMLLGSAATLGGCTLAAPGAAAGGELGPRNTLRIGVISATIRGKPQPRNGHTWHFAQYLQPTIDLEAFCALVDPGTASFFRRYVRNPKTNFGQLPFPDIRIAQYFDTDRRAAADFARVFPGVEVAKSVEDMVGQVDAVWLGDASGYGDDHFDLVAPGLEKGLPTFCDKPIGGTPAGTRKILEFARRHRAPLMSSSLFSHEWGTEAALRMRDAGTFGPIRYVIASLQSGYTDDGWMLYGQHPAWMVMTLLGPGVEAVSMYAQENTCHALVTYKDRMPAEIWYGRPSAEFSYNHTEVHFEKKRYEYTPAIEGDFWYGHHYEMFRMAATFRDMVRTRREPIPHREIPEVTAIIHAAAKSRAERSRLVPLAEVL